MHWNILHSKYFAGLMPFLSPNQQHKNTKGTDSVHKSRNAYKNALHLSLAFLFAKNPTKL